MQATLSNQALRYHAEEAARNSESAHVLSVGRVDELHARCFGLSTPISGDHLRTLPGTVSVWDVLKARDDS